MTTIRKRLWGLSIGALLIGITCGGFAQDDDDEGALDVGGADTLQTLLAREIGNEVTVRLTSGQELQGTVVGSGNHLVHLSRLPVKDVAHAIVPINQIEAVFFKGKGGS